MNREILFRGKRKSSRKQYQTWVYGGLFKDIDGTCYILFNNETGDIEFEEVIPETVSQYTGLIDNNGKKIFENDEVIYYRKTWFTKNGKKIFDYKNNRFYILYDDGCFIINKYKDKITNKSSESLLGCLIEEETIEVIGTIFDKEVK